jgi:hypothetical protein
MIYELRNKVPQNSSFTCSEDVLTSTIFGNLRYFFNQEILINFLNQSINMEGKYLTLNNDDCYIIKFWEKYTTMNYSKINEPDLLLLNKENVIIIECKYFSFLNEEGNIIHNRDAYDNQLLQYSNIIKEYYMNTTNKIIIFLTNDKVKPVDLLNKTLEKLDPEIKLFWLPWTKLYKCMRDYNVCTLNNGERQLYDDMINFIKKRNLTGFCGFDDNNIFCETFYHKKYCFSELETKDIRWRFRHE